MLIGVPKEIKNNEYRVGLTPFASKELTTAGHSVLIECDAGVAIGFHNEDYIAAGASIVKNAADIFQQAELIVKVKEPQAGERKMLQPGQTLFTYLHLAPDTEQTQDLIHSGATCIAYETVTDAKGGLPLLAPMSEVAGRMSIQAGAHCLEKYKGGRGILLGGVAGVAPAKVVIIGGGVVGSNALAIAVGMGATVTVLDRNIDTLRAINRQYLNQVTTIFSTSHHIAEQIKTADLVIGSVLIAGAAAPKIITREMIKTMKLGSVFVDVAIDQGGCSETSRPTTHENPIYMVDNVVHYCVANIPGAVARTSTLALNNATLPFVLELANKGVKTALTDNIHLRNGLSTCQQHLTCEKVAAAQNIPYQPAMACIRDL